MEKIRKSDEDWRAELTPAQYRVTRAHGTERPGSCALHEPGLYGCVCCGLPLFDTREKFESGTGWPSFTEPVDPSHVEATEDRSLGMVRTEVHCARCDAHLGHVFLDGPPPTGLRYCINGIALQKLD